MPIKRTKSDVECIDEQYIVDEDNNDDEIVYEMEGGGTEEDQNEKVEIVYLANNDRSYNYTSSEDPEPRTTEISSNNEEKFISMVYPNFKGKTKLQLIDEIFDLKRRNELLKSKVKTYENTINKLLT